MDAGNSNNYAAPTSTNPQLSNPTKKPSKNFLKVLSSKYLITLSAVIFIILIAAGFSYFYRQGLLKPAKVIKPTVMVLSTKSVHYFSVVSVSPGDGSTGNDPNTPIKITFSEPVKPDSLRSYFTVSPMIPGTFTQGATPNEVVFTAKFPFGEGTSVKVILNQGFESIAGHKFTTDYSYNFFTKIPENSVMFGNNDTFSRWLNLPVGQSTTFNLQTGSDVSPDATVTVYKATFDKIVSSLLYGSESHSGTNYETQTFLDYPVDTSKLNKVSETTIKDSPYFTFSQPEGLYYIEAKDNNSVIGSTWVSVNDEGLIVRQDDQKLTIAAQNIKTGDINSSVKVYLYNLQDKPTLLKTVQIQGFGDVPLAYPQTVDLVVGQTQSGVILAPLSIPESQADIRVTDNLSRIDRIYLQTDRPTYLGGETVKFSGIVRVNNDAAYGTPSDPAAVEVWVPDPSNPSSNLIDQTVTTSSGGIISGQFTLPSATTSDQNNTASLTLYAAAKTDGIPNTLARSYTTFDVVSKSYNSTLTVNFDNSNYTKDQPVVAHISATDASGNPLANQSVSYTVYSKDYYEDDPTSKANIGSDWGSATDVANQTVTLDAKGQADVKINPTGTLSQTITLEAWTTDSSGDKIYGAKTVLVHQGKIFLTFGPSRHTYHSGDTVISRVYALDLNGNPQSNLGLNYEIYKSVWSAAANSYQETVLYQGSGTTDGNGFLQINQPVTTDAPYITLRVMTKDSSGNNIQAEQTDTVISGNTNSNSLYYHDPILANLDVYPDKRSYNVGDTANLKINSPFDQNVLVTYESGRIYHDEWLHLNKGDNDYQISITSTLFPSFNLVFSYFKDGELNVEGLPITINDPTKKLNLSVAADKTTYTKNGQAELTVTTKDNTGNPISANIQVSVLDNDIFNLRDNLPSGDIYWSFYSPRQDQTNFTASTLGIGTGGGCGGGSGTDIVYVPNLLGNNYYWNPNLTTDQNGQLTVTVPLPSISTTLRFYVTASTESTSIGQYQSTIQVQ